MKKRIFSFVAAMVLILSMGMTAFAAGSPVVDDYFATSATTNVNGVPVELVFDYYIYDAATEIEAAELDKYFFAETEEAADAYVKTLFESVTGYTSSTDPAKAPFVMDFFGLRLPEGFTMPAGGIDVTINAPYVKAGDTQWFMLHMKADGSWEFIKSTAGNGTLTGKFTSFSPVYVICAPDAKAPAATTTTNATTTTKAPKTGEFVGIYVAGMFALISAAGILVYTKRRKTVR